VTLEPEIEVEYVEAALDLAARGLGDTIGTRRIALGRNFLRRLHNVGFDPPVVDTFAFVTRRNAHLSPATRAFMEIASRRMEALGRRGPPAE
jgi:DNA-binding transcriptional LysR family regulator